MNSAVNTDHKKKHILLKSFISFIRWLLASAEISERGLGQFMHCIVPWIRSHNWAILINYHDTRPGFSLSVAYFHVDIDKRTRRMIRD